MKLHIFHDWSKWEQYDIDVEVILTGLWFPIELRGKRVIQTQHRQKRHCLECNFEQDKEIKSE